LSENKNIEIRSFGSFKTKSRKGRTGRNPRTGDPVIIKEYIIPIFKVSKEGQNIFDLKVKNRSKAAKAPTTV
jgi:nucleoid DNA-binding protein